MGNPVHFIITLMNIYLLTGRKLVDDWSKPIKILSPVFSLVNNNPYHVSLFLIHYIYVILDRHSKFSDEPKYVQRNGTGWIPIFNTKGYTI